MLYWICPECGHECSPAIRECPTCTAPPAAANGSREAPAQTAAIQPEASQELLTLAQNFQPPASTVRAPAQPRPSQLLLATNGHETSVSTTSVAVEDEPLEPAKELASLDDLALRPARPARLRAVKLSPAPVPARIAPPAVAPPETATRAEWGLKLAGPAPAGEIHFKAAHARRPKATVEPAEPLPSRRQSVAFVRTESNGVDCSVIPVGELVPPNLVVPHRDGSSANGASAPLACQPNGPSFVASGLKLTGESLAELQNALMLSAQEIARAGIQAIQTSFAEQPAVGLLAAPAEIVAAPAPPAAQWMRSAKPKFTPIAPENAGRAVALAGPQTPTLAGPSLPPQLLNFDRQNSSLRPRRKRWSMWPLSFLVVMALILSVVTGLQYLSPDRDTTKPPSAAAPVQTLKPAPARPLPVLEEHPAARSVEVAGIRILTAPNKKPQLQFIVINHSSSELTGLNIRIAVRDVDAPDGAPLFTVSSVVAALAPNQSKEIRTDVNSSLPPSAIPDWQSLRTEVLIGRL